MKFGAARIFQPIFLVALKHIGKIKKITPPLMTEAAAAPWAA